MDKKVVLNGSIIHEKPTGLGVYAINIFRELTKSDKIQSVRVFSPVDIEEIEVEKINKFVKPSYKKYGAIARFLWTQLVLPFKVKKDETIYHPFQYLSFFTSNKQIITIHDLIPLYYPKIARHQNFYYKYIMPILLKKADRIICISENTKKDLEKFYKLDTSKIKVVHNGYDKELFNKNNLDISVRKKFNLEEDYMIMVGAGYKHKNLEKVIKAIKNLEQNYEMKIAIVGGNSKYIEELKELVNKLNLNDRISFLGYVSDNELKSLYAYAYAFIYPTLYEGFGLPILEASACGTVVVCSNNSSLPEVYGNSALSFDPSNIIDIEEKIKIIIDNKELRESLIEKSSENIKRFSWRKTVESIEEVL